MLDCLLSMRQAGNLYVYTLNNPLMWRDPTGEFAKHISSFFDNLSDNWSDGVADLKGSNNAILRGFGNFSQGYANRTYQHCRLMTFLLS
jgi:hypothetical protein